MCNVIQRDTAMKKILILLAGLLLINFCAGCAKVAVQGRQADTYAKEFNPPPSGWSGLYIYRTRNIMGSALQKSLYVDGQFIGETARGVFFYRLVEPGMHILKTESEFSENDLEIQCIEGKNHYVNQALRPGLFVGGAYLSVVEETEAQNDIKGYRLAENKDNPEKNLEEYTGRPGTGSIPGPRNRSDFEILNTTQESD